MRNVMINLALMVVGILMVMGGLIVGLRGIENFSGDIVIGLGIMIVGQILCGFGFGFHKG